MLSATTVLTIGNTMIVAGVLLGIVLVARAARRGPPRLATPPPVRGNPVIAPPRGREWRDSAATTPLHQDTAATSTWRGDDRWDDQRPGWEPDRTDRAPGSESWGESGWSDSGSSGGDSGSSGGSDSSS
jgi:uncharacterized membrane protein YgcG